VLLDKALSRLIESAVVGGDGSVGVVTILLRRIFVAPYFVEYRGVTGVSHFAVMAPIPKNYP
jgi:hypothetical protein